MKKTKITTTFSDVKVGEQFVRQSDGARFVRVFDKDGGARNAACLEAGDAHGRAKPGALWTFMIGDVAVTVERHVMTFSDLVPGQRFRIIGAQHPAPLTKIDGMGENVLRADWTLGKVLALDLVEVIA